MFSIIRDYSGKPTCQYSREGHKYYDKNKEIGTI